MSYAFSFSTPKFSNSASIPQYDFTSTSNNLTQFLRFHDNFNQIPNISDCILPNLKFQHVPTNVQLNDSGYQSLESIKKRQISELKFSIDSILSSPSNNSDIIVHQNNENISPLSTRTNVTPLYHHSTSRLKHCSQRDYQIKTAYEHLSSHEQLFPIDLSIFNCKPLTNQSVTCIKKAVEQYDCRYCGKTYSVKSSIR
ncbi:unnamed protein product [Heterobilharzia americana]|nr:unnamed protein product [Heterobilharzia americana]